jgi:NADH:ubiquinone oxidoreductase subunit 2 (subunit N)
MAADLTLLAGSSTPHTQAIWWFYLLGYLSLTLQLVWLLWLSGAQFSKTSLDVLTLQSAGASTVWRLTAIALFAAMAGLPPFFFFFCKLAFLSLLLRLQLWGTLAALLAFLFVGWYAYQVGMLRVASSVTASPTRPRKHSGLAAILLGLLSFAVLGGALFLDDLLLCSLWLASF